MALDVGDECARRPRGAERVREQVEAQRQHVAVWVSP